MEEHYWQKHQMKNYMPYNCSNCEESYFILDEYLFHSSTCNPGMQLTKYFCNTCPYVTFDKTIFLGMISHKISLITIFGHKHFRQKFHQKFDIFHEKISTASDFGSYLVSNFKF